MLNLIVHQLNKTNPGLISTELAGVDAIRNAHVPSEHKKDILSFIQREAGLETLLSIGQGIQSAAYDPVWFTATRSVSPTFLFEKWRRFEMFAHSQNRVKIDEAHEKRALFNRHTVDGGSPTTPENLLICGLLIALLEEIGCRGLRCEMFLEDGKTHIIRENHCFFVPRDPGKLVTTSWTIEWKEFSARENDTPPAIGTLDIGLSNWMSQGQSAAINTSIQHLAIDVARQWTVGDLAREMGVSVRSLQRKLREAKLSFSRLVRLVRIHEACRLLRDQTVPITAIGFCTGFADSAHFSRDFRASTGMTPSDYRKVCL